MQKFIRFLGVAIIIVAAISFILLLTQNAFLIAFLAIISGGISCIPLFCLADAMDNIDKLQWELTEIKGKLHNFLPESNSPPRQSAQNPSYSLLSMGSVWDCKKCGCTNKPGAKKCENCGEKY